MLVRAEDGTIYNLAQAYRVYLQPVGEDQFIVAVDYESARETSAPISEMRAAATAVRLTGPKSHDEAQEILGGIVKNMGGVDLTGPMAEASLEQERRGAFRKSYDGS